MARYFARRARAGERARIAATRFSRARRRCPAARSSPRSSTCSSSIRIPKPYADDAGTLHAMIAAWQLVPSTRNRIADPASGRRTPSRSRTRTRRASLALLRSEQGAQPRRRCAATRSPARSRQEDRDVELARPPECIAHGYDANQAAICRAAGTTAFAVADADGNVVAATQTLGTWGGNFYVTPGLGFLYNDKLTRTARDPNAYGARLPFARHGSTIAPTIVFEGTGSRSTRSMALGAAGNAWITSAVYQTLVGMIDEHLDPQAALELPRFLIGGGFGGGGGAAARQPRRRRDDPDRGWLLARRHEAARGRWATARRSSRCRASCAKATARRCGSRRAESRRAPIRGARARRARCPEGFSGQDYFPEALGRKTFYDPPERGFEREIRKRLDYWAKLRREKAGK